MAQTTWRVPAPKSWKVRLGSEELGESETASPSKLEDHSLAVRNFGLDSETGTLHSRSLPHLHILDSRLIQIWTSFGGRTKVQLHRLTGLFSTANEKFPNLYIIDFSHKCWSGTQVQRGAR